MFYCLWKAHVERMPNKFFSFHGMFSLCAVKPYVENIPWKPGLMRRSVIQNSGERNIYGRQQPPLGVEIHRETFASIYITESNLGERRMHLIKALCRAELNYMHKFLRLNSDPVNNNSHLPCIQIQIPAVTRQTAAPHQTL